VSEPLWELLAGCRVYDLSHPLAEGLPVSPNQPGYRLALKRRHGDAERADGSSAASELLMLGGHTGTHVDALCHVSHRGRLHGGIDAYEAQRGGRFSRLGVETLEPVLGRGVLLDVPALLGVDRLAPGAAVSAADLAAAARRQGIEVAPGDAVLVRTGWGELWDDPEAFVGAGTGVPGPDDSAARWLADRGVRITGGETLAYERITAAHGHALLPVHRILLVEAGIPIVEAMRLCELARDGVGEFLLVLVPLRLTGATGSPVRPLAIVPPPGGER
jgi:kynurenine formamidase